jgi:hypothetical protein
MNEIERQAQFPTKDIALGHRRPLTFQVAPAWQASPAILQAALPALTTGVRLPAKR